MYVFQHTKVNNTPEKSETATATLEDDLSLSDSDTDMTPVGNDISEKIYNYELDSSNSSDSSTTTCEVTHTSNQTWS